MKCKAVRDRLRVVTCLLREPPNAEVDAIEALYQLS